MDVEARDFLLKEFETAWAHLRVFDGRRFQILQYYSAFVGAMAIATITVIDKIVNQDVKHIGLVILLLITIAMSHTCNLNYARKRPEYDPVVRWIA